MADKTGAVHKKQGSSNTYSTDIKVDLDNSSPQKSFNKIEPQIKKENKSKKVTFSKNFVEIVEIKSYKEFNIDISTGGYKTDNTGCNCIII